MTSLKRMSCLVERAICNSSVLCMDDGCHGFISGKQLATSCLHQVNCRLNPNSSLNTETLNLIIDPTP